MAHTAQQLKLQTDFALTNDTPYLALMGKLWGVLHELFKEKWQWHIDGLAQDCSNSIANALELLQSCTKLSIWRAHWPVGGAFISASGVVRPSGVKDSVLTLSSELGEHRMMVSDLGRPVNWVILMVGLFIVGDPPLTVARRCLLSCTSSSIPASARKRSASDSLSFSVLKQETRG